MSTILIVEDEFAIADLLEMVLTDAGHHILRAANGRQALERLEEGPRPDLIITDFMMPVLNAAGIIHEIRNDPQSRDIPYVIMSSMPEANIRERVQGYVAFLRKPFSLLAIVPLIAGILSGTDRDGADGARDR